MLADHFNAMSEAIGRTEHGRPFAAAVARENVFATQFHPEKSGPTGLRLLANFVRICAAERVE